MGYLAAGLAVIVLLGLGLVRFTYPNVSPAEELSIEYTPDRIERGAYLANHVTVCMDCHSSRDFSLFSGPPTPGTIGKGGDKFDHGMGFPGTFFAKNITPHGISGYSDGELYRVITTGVTQDGSPLFPVMPYSFYGKMDPEDIYDIIAYVRSLPAVASEIPESQADFPVNLILRTIPVDATPTAKPSPTDQVAYGAYLINAASCVECHTPIDPQGTIVREKSYSGGRNFPFPDGSMVTSSNLTQDASTGIGSWTEEMFVARFKQYDTPGNQASKVAPGDFNTIMPWVMYAGMKEEDLKAIYAYLKTVEAIPNAVTKFTPAPTGE